MVSRRGFLGMLGVAAVAPTYFFAPVGGWTSSLILNPNELPAAQEIHKPKGVYGMYNWIDIGAMEGKGIPISEPLLQGQSYSVPWLKPYKRSETLRRKLSTLPDWTWKTKPMKPLIFV